VFGLPIVLILSALMRHKLSKWPNAEPKCFFLRKYYDLEGKEIK
jgi:hypothetical protein